VVSAFVRLLPEQQHSLPIENANTTLKKGKVSISIIAV